MHKQFRLLALAATLFCTGMHAMKDGKPKKTLPGGSLLATLQVRVDEQQAAQDKKMHQIAQQFDTTLIAGRFKQNLPAVQVQTITQAIHYAFTHAPASTLDALDVPAETLSTHQQLLQHSAQSYARSHAQACAWMVQQGAWSAIHQTALTVLQVRLGISTHTVVPATQLMLTYPTTHQRDEEGAEGEEEFQTADLATLAAGITQVKLTTNPLAIIERLKTTLPADKALVVAQAIAQGIDIGDTPNVQVTDQPVAVQKMLLQPEHVEHAQLHALAIARVLAQPEDHTALQEALNACVTTVMSSLMQQGYRNVCALCTAVPALQGFEQPTKRPHGQIADERGSESNEEEDEEPTGSEEKETVAAPDTLDGGTGGLRQRRKTQSTQEENEEEEEADSDDEGTGNDPTCGLCRRCMKCLTDAMRRIGIIS